MSRQKYAAEQKGPQTAIGKRSSGFGSQGAADKARRGLNRIATQEKVIGAGAMIGGGILAVGGGVASATGVGTVPGAVGMVTGLSTVAGGIAMLKQANRDELAASAAQSQRKALEDLVRRGQGRDLGSRAHMKESAAANDLARAAKEIKKGGPSASARVHSAEKNAPMNKPHPDPSNSKPGANASGSNNSAPAAGRPRGFQIPKVQAAAQAARGAKYDGPTE